MEEGTFVGEAVKCRDGLPMRRRIGALVKSLRRKISDKGKTVAKQERSILLLEAYSAFSKLLIGAQTDDDVFKAVFSAFRQRSGIVFGVAMICDADAELRVVVRFGVPVFDSLDFCQKLAQPITGMVLEEPSVMALDAQEHIDMFDPSIHHRLAGLSVLAIPLLPNPGELIGLIVLYRKGEQPFTPEDVGFAGMIAHPAALAIERTP